jgi:virginiamycin B lyase
VNGIPGTAGEPGADSVWRIDPAANDLTATIAISDPFLFAAGEGAVWASQLENQTVARIDPATNRVVDQVEVGYVGSIAAGAGAVWAVTSVPDALTLTRIDPTANAVAATIRLSVDFYDVAAGDEGVWASVF